MAPKLGKLFLNLGWWGGCRGGRWNEKEKHDLFHLKTGVKLLKQGCIRLSMV